ncbi:hypothetical protein JXO59_16035 [candidate division KSB1 bacterium]|nr:hypothetical protein [candidate division KSB1 bacterium]
MLKKIHIVIIFTLLLVSLIFAQQRNWGVGPHLFVSLPQTGFENFSKDGEGIGAKLFYRFNNPYLSLRADFAYISYGERRESEFIYNYYSLVTRRIESMQFYVGPQFTFRMGRLTAYLASMGGWYHYHTVETVEDYYSYYPYSETTDSQNKWGYNIGGGILIDLGLGPHLDFGVKYQTILNAESYVNGNKVEKDATDFCITLGVVFFLR